LPDAPTAPVGVRQTDPVTWTRTSTLDRLPDDPVGEAVAATIVEILGAAAVDLVYFPDGAAPPPTPADPPLAVASGPGPAGWQVQVSVRLGEEIAPILSSANTSLRALVAALPAAALVAAHRFSGLPTDTALSPALHRALRDTVASELLERRLAARFGPEALPSRSNLIAEIVDYLVELSGIRVESHDLTHGVIVTNALPDHPRLSFEYPACLRSAKRGPLLFDGQRSVLVVDSQGLARTELQRHRLGRLGPDRWARHDAYVDSGSLVAEATRRLGGVGFFLRADRTIWAFLDGQPLLMRRGAHWTAFPMELEASIDHLIEGGPAARLVVEAAFMLSAQGRGAILAIADSAKRLDGIVSPKDRYDLRDDVDPLAMQVETRLHHLIDADALDEHTLARLAALDGATILDRKANLLAYGAIVSSNGSQYEGARTAAAKTLSETTDIVLKVSVDGDITVFHSGQAIVTLLGQPSRD
jgi:hypothetical protein